jgi:hypothetical protein
MTANLRNAILLAALFALPGCHPDPFGTRPEVRGVRLPDPPAQPPPVSEAEEAEEKPE